MTHAQRLLNSILRHGTAATVKEYTGGTVCPCMTSRGTEAPAYSLDWHRRNPLATDCGGRGVIGSTPSLTNIKTMIIDASAIGNTVRHGGKMVDVGEINAGDMALYGAVKTADGTNYSFDGLKDWNEITVNGRVYCAKKIILIYVDGIGITAAIVRRIS